MTLQRLNEHYDLVQKLVTAREALVRLRAAAEPGAQRLTGMPHATGTSDIVSALSVNIVMTRERVEALEKEVAESAAEIQNWISTIDDDFVRTLIVFRYLCGLQWGEVAASIGGGNTESSVKMACYRFIME
jgi:hypothetical protein